MKGKRVAAIVVGFVIFASLTLVPNRARAFDISKPLIIGGAVAGAVVLAAVIVVAVRRYRDEPSFLVPDGSPTGRRQTLGVADRFRFGPECPLTANSTTLVCW